MALKKYYIGSHGPFYYDDAELINDPDGDFAGEFYQLLVGEGTIKVLQSASDDDDVVRQEDLDDAVAGAITRLTATVVASPPSLTAGQSGVVTSATTVTGAAVGDHVIVSTDDTVAQVLILHGYVSSANTVKVVMYNFLTVTITPTASKNYYISVIPPS